MTMELKKSLMERLYTFCVQNDWHVIRKLIHKVRDLCGYKYCLSFHTPIGWSVDPYPRTLEEAQCYESLYIEYYHYDEVQIVETKYLLY